MIPREIRKKIRQIELRANHIVDRMLAGDLFYSPGQFCRISGTMPNCKNFDLTMCCIDGEVYGIRPRRRHFCFVRQLRRQEKTFRIFRQALQKSSESVVEPQSNALFAFFVPTDSVVPVPFRIRLGDDFEGHFFAKRRWISADTSSMGVPRPGFFKASFARRSSSAICSGVNSSLKSPNSISMISTSSRRSTSGIRRNSSRISALLMPLIYSRETRRQAAFVRPSRFTHHVSRST